MLPRLDEACLLLKLLDILDNPGRTYVDGKSADRLNKSHRSRRRWKLRGERSIEFDVIDGEAPQVRKRRERGAEVAQ